MILEALLIPAATFLLEFSQREFGEYNGNVNKDVLIWHQQ